MQKIGLFFASLLVMSAFLLPSTVMADANTTSVCEGLALTGGTCGDTTSGPTVDSTVKLAINILSWIVGIVSVVMIIIGGFKYVTSTGDSSNVNSAKNTILYAVIGLVIVALAQIIVKFVLNKVGS